MPQRLTLRYNRFLQTGVLYSGVEFLFDVMAIHNKKSTQLGAAKICECRGRFHPINKSDRKLGTGEFEKQLLCQRMNDFHAEVQPTNK